MDPLDQRDSTSMPYELLRLIAENLTGDKSSLCTLSLSSGTLRQEAQRILFRDVTTLKSARGHIQFLHRVTSSPTHLALLVRSYKLPEMIDLPAEVLTELFLAMCDAFKMMRDLKSLEVWVTYQMKEHLNYGQSLRLCTFNNLERFGWMSPFGDADDIIHSFLPRQSTLKHLGIIVSDKSSMLDPLRPIPSTTCPQLVSLAGGLTVFKAFLPDRRITTLSLPPDDLEPINERSTRPLATELQDVKIISCPSDTMARRDMYNDGFLQYFPSVNVLQLHRFPINETPHPLKLSALLRILARLPALEKLILSANKWLKNGAGAHNNPTPWMETLQKDDPNFSRRIFENTRGTFLCIDIEIRPGKYARYTRFGEGIQEINEQEETSFLT